MPDRELLLERLERLAIVLDELMPGCAELVRDALSLLKEQEAVEPKTTITYNRFHYDYCGNCGRLLPVAQDFEKANYCPSCGRMVKWE